MSPRRLHGISKIEVMVVVAIFGLLAALMLPAIGAAREAARRTNCRGHLKRLGLALHNYHASFRVLPSGIDAPSCTTLDPKSYRFVASAGTCDDVFLGQTSGLTLLLPFLEENRVYTAYNRQLASCAMQNHTAGASIVRGYVCPSNPRQNHPIESSYFLTPPNVAKPTGPAPTDYVFSMGGVGLFTCDNPFTICTGCYKVNRIPGIMSRAAGAFNVFEYGGVTLDKIKDGTANTFLMGESAGGAELYLGLVGTKLVAGAEKMTTASSTKSCDNAWAQAWIGSPSGQSFGSIFAATAWNAWYDPQGNLTDPANGANWFPYPINEGKLRLNRPTWALNSRSPADMTGSNGAALPSSSGSVQGFRSFHPNMAQFLMGDGSVRSISESVDARLLVAFSSIVGKEPLDHSE